MSTQQNQSGQDGPSQTTMSILPPPPPWVPGGAGQGGYGGGGNYGDGGHGGPGGPGETPPGHGKRRHRRLAMTAGVAAVGLAVGAGAMYGLNGTSTAATAASTTALSTSQIASRVSPGLVDIVSTLGYQGAKAAGTGMVVTSSGEVLTNNHVIDGATSIKATDVGNGRTYTATVVGYDKTDDVAVLQLQGASGLTTVSFGDSSNVTAGETVVALGNAGGKGGTPSVAAGSVTGLNRAITASDEGSGTSESLTGMIQTNADIQAGDSGGSLVNAQGQVIGMDTAASSSSEMSSPYGSSPYGSSPYGSSPYGQSSGSSSSQPQTQGFAIPINKALSIADEIEAGNTSSTVHIGATGFLGVEVGSSGSSFMPGGEQDSSGVAVAGTLSGSPAAGAGLSQGDVINSVNGHAVSSSSDVQSVIGQDHPGDKVSVSWTDQSGQTHTSTITLANGPAD